MQIQAVLAALPAPGVLPDGLLPGFPPSLLLLPLLPLWLAPEALLVAVVDAPLDLASPPAPDAD